MWCEGGSGGRRDKGMVENVVSKQALNKSKQSHRQYNKAGM